MKFFGRGNRSNYRSEDFTKEIHEGEERGMNEYRRISVGWRGNCAWGGKKKRKREREKKENGREWRDSDEARSRPLKLSSNDAVTRP